MGICTVSSTSFRRKEPSQYWLMYFFPFSFSPGDLLDCFQKASMLTFKPICQEENSAFWSCYKRERVSGGAGAARSCVDHQPPQHAKEEIPSLQVFSLCLQFLLQYFPLLLVCVCVQLTGNRYLWRGEGNELQADVRWCQSVPLRAMGKQRQWRKLITLSTLLFIDNAKIKPWEPRAWYLYSRGIF